MVIRLHPEEERNLRDAAAAPEGAVILSLDTLRSLLGEIDFLRGKPAPLKDTTPVEWRSLHAQPGPGPAGRAPWD